MANVIIYDKTTGEVKQYLESVNTPDYPDALKVASKPTVELKFLKVVDGKLTTLSQTEQDSITAKEQKVIDDAKKEFEEKIDSIKDTDGIKKYLKEQYGYLS